MSSLEALAELLGERGVVTRYRGTEKHCTGCLRVTVGTPKENDALLRLLVQVAAEMGM